MGDGDKKTGGVGGRIGAQGGVGIPTTASNEGYGGGASVGVERRYLDRTFFVQLEAEYARKYAKLYTGIEQAYDSFVFALSFGKTDLSVREGERDVEKDTIQQASTREGVVSYERQSYPGGDDETLFLGSRSRLGWRFFFGEERGGYVEPSVGLETGTLFPFVDKDEIGELPGSPTVIKFLAQLVFGFGSDTKEQIGDNAPTILGSSYIFSRELLEHVQRFLQYRLYDRYGDPFSDSNKLQDRDGDRYMWDVPGLYLIQAVMEGQGISEFVEGCYFAYRSGSPNCYILAVGRLVAGAVSLGVGANQNTKTVGGGNVLITGGFVDLVKGGAALVSLTGIDTRYQLLIQAVLGAAVEVGGAAAGAPNVSLAGAEVMTGVTMYSDQTRGRIVKKKSVIVRPYNAQIMGGEKASASIAKRSELEHGIILETEADTPIVKPQNVGEVVQGKPPNRDVGTSTRLRNHVGWKGEMVRSRSFSLDAALMAHTVFVTGPGKPTAGGGASVAVEARMKLPSFLGFENPDLTIGGRALVEKPFDDKASVIVGPSISFGWGSGE